MKNIVLIGMPGSGKSTVGALLAGDLGRPLVETDALVEEAAGRPIPAIFAEDGEGHFRDLEEGAVARAAAEAGAVVSTGGGVILRWENIKALQKSGLVFFLDRPPEEIAGENHKGRPLIGGDRDRVFALYEARIDRYRVGAQYTVTGVTPREVADKILIILQEVGDAP